MGMMHQQQFQKVTLTKHQSVFEPRQLQSLRTHVPGIEGEDTEAGAGGGDGEEHPPPLPYKKRHSKCGFRTSIDEIFSSRLAQHGAV